MAGRAYDILLVGGTGYTGRLVAGHLAKHAPAGARIAVAGRSRERLRELVRGVDGASRWAVIEAELVPGGGVRDVDALRKAVQASRVCCSVAGPYALCGRELVGLCAREGCDYVDITGELQFVRESIRENHAAAERSGSRIVHCCGYDSVPMDMSALMAMERMAADAAVPARDGEHDGAPTGANVHDDGVAVDVVDIEGVVGPCYGGFSGGTIASGFNVLSDPSARSVALDPLALNLNDEHGGSPGRVVVEGLPDQSFLGRLRHGPPPGAATTATFPSVMAVVNTRVVRRSAELLGYAHPAPGGEARATRFRFSEATLAPSYVAGLAISVVSVVIGSLLRLGCGAPHGGTAARATHTVRGR